MGKYEYVPRNRKTCKNKYSGELTEKKILLSFENEAKPNTYFLFYVSVCVSIYVLWVQLNVWHEQIQYRKILQEVAFMLTLETASCLLLVHKVSYPENFTSLLFSCLCEVVMGLQVPIWLCLALIFYVGS